MYDVIDSDTDCWAQNGGTHGRVFATFKRRFLTNRTRDGVKSIYIIQFQSIRTVMLSWFGSPLKTATVLCKNVDDDCLSLVLQGDTMVKDCFRMLTHEFHDYDLRLGSQSGFCCEYLQMDGMMFLSNCHMNKVM